MKYEIEEEEEEDGKGKERKGKASLLEVEEKRVLWRHQE